MWLQLFKGSTEHGSCPNWLRVQTRMPCVQVWAPINEGIVFKVFCRLCRLSKWGVGPFEKRKPFICAGTAELVWRASLCFSYHRKLEESPCIKPPIWSQYGDCLLSVLYFQSILPFLHCDELDIYYLETELKYYFAMCTCGPSCELTGCRSHLARCREVVNNSVKGFNPMTGREYFHEISSRFGIINSMPVLSSSNSMLWSHTGPLSVQKSSLPQLCF